MDALEKLIENDVDREELRRLQDRAIRAIELLFPNARELNRQRVAGGGPTVAEARMCLFPRWRWIWEEWIQEAQKAGHDI